MGILKYVSKVMNDWHYYFLFSFLFFSYILPAQEGSNLIYIPITACNFLSIFIVVTRDPASNMVNAVKGVEDTVLSF